MVATFDADERIPKIMLQKNGGKTTKRKPQKEMIDKIQDMEKREKNWEEIKIKTGSRRVEMAGDLFAIVSPYLWK